MTWDYRVLSYDSGDFGIHEVFYDDGDKPTSCTETAVGAVADTVYELRIELAHMVAALDKPVLAFESFTTPPPNPAPEAKR